MDILKFNVFNFLNKSKKTTVPLDLLCPTFPYSKKLRDLRLRNASLVEIEENLEEISDLMIFPERFHGPSKTLWRATCGPRAANCPPLPYRVGNEILLDRYIS